MRWSARSRRPQDGSNGPRRSAARAPGHVAVGFVALADADVASASDPERAVTLAEVAHGIGSDLGHSDLAAMGLHARGRHLLACGRHREGMRALDEAMIAVTRGELSPLFTGWILCNALAACHDLADIARATEWVDAAMRWCGRLADGSFYPGTCRLHVVELASLRGHWDEAEAAAAEACAELTAHDERYAGDAHYLLGELHRRRGDLGSAEERFVLAHAVGRDPQPGLARIRLAQGRTDVAIRSLDAAVATAGPAPMRRIELLCALVEAHAHAGDAAAAERTRASLDAVDVPTGSDYLVALRLLARATTHLAGGEPTEALAAASDARDGFRRLGVPYDEARACRIRGLAARALGDDDTARMDLDRSAVVFTRLGAAPDLSSATAAVHLGDRSPLSARETEVLAILARGATNKEIAAELHVSEHTVARHLSNLYTKLDVHSRAAATAAAYERSLI